MTRSKFVRSILCVALAIPACAAPAKLPEASAILDRYVAVTGGAAGYRKFSAEVIEITVTSDDGHSFGMTEFRARDGRRQAEIDAGPASRKKGVVNGVAWEFSQSGGARILTGKAAERELAMSHGLGADTWREEFPTAVTRGEEVIQGIKCYRVRLIRKDGSVVDRLYEERSGLLRREESTALNEAGADEPVIRDIEEYADWRGLQHPSSMRLTKGGRVFKIKIESVDHSAIVPPDAFVLPPEVVRAIAARNNNGSLPNAVELVEKFIELTGGKNAYQSIQTQTLKAVVTFKGAGMKGQLVTYAAEGGKQYESFDLPGAGKFESGSDGATGWERSVMLGPRLLPRSQAGGGLLGPAPDQVLRWTTAFLNVESVSKDEANGTPCYLVQLTPKQEGELATTFCFDMRSGYLTRMTATVKNEGGKTALDALLSDYREAGPVKMPYHLETKAGGQPVSVDVTDVIVNGPLPDGIFELPNDVRALKEKHEAAAPGSPDRPTLKRGHKGGK
jgi:hypothetical protein